jgi:hypothetical protein
MLSATMNTYLLFRIILEVISYNKIFKDQDIINNLVYILIDKEKLIDENKFN